MRCRVLFFVVVTRLAALSWPFENGGAATALADDFRVESKVYLGEEEEPSTEATTLFRGGVVYDFLSEPEEVTVFDVAGGRFVLLDPKRKIKIEIGSREVQDFAEEVRKKALAHKQPLLRFLADPKFRQTADEGQKELLFASQWVTYRVKSAPAKNEATARQYGEFCDWTARLNCLVNPSALPPFGRLAVNDALRQRGELPTEVELVVFPEKLPRKRITMRSEHRVQWRLLEADQQRLERVADWLTTFRSVNFDDFHRPDTSQARR